MDAGKFFKAITGTVAIADDEQAAKKKPMTADEAYRAQTPSMADGTKAGSGAAGFVKGFNNPMPVSEKLSNLVRSLSK